MAGKTDGMGDLTKLNRTATRMTNRQASPLTTQETSGERLKVRVVVDGDDTTTTSRDGKTLDTITLADRAEKRGTDPIIFEYIANTCR